MLSRGWMRAASIVAVGALVMLPAACNSSEGDEVVADVGELGHIHDLVVTDDGTLLVASHTGLWRVEGSSRAVLVGTGRHDLMAMAQLEDRTLVASGHPDLRADEYRIDGQPPFLGLARSDDGGQSWRIDELLGKADFHAFVEGGNYLYAAETAGRIWRLDHEGVWVELGEIDARDLALDPEDPSRQLAPDYDGTIWLSVDGAATWAILEGAPIMVEVEWPTDGRVVGVDAQGRFWSTPEPGQPWTEFASGQPGVETFHIDTNGAWWVTVHGGAIARSDDNALSWTDIYTPP